MGKCCSKRQEPQPIGYTKAETGLSSKHSNGGSLDRYTADPNQRGVQARADIIRPRPTPCKLQIPHHPRKTSSPVVMPACVYYFTFSSWFILVVQQQQQQQRQQRQQQQQQRQQQQ
ncbi:tyrosine-protein kinase Src64B isoform X1 [Vespula maculifrons]|uniref:Tyrosine-protein kinase Src64B isoform X1 n=1 Tax=Vespula maculifrons TaxID=7453 RepID=A0ABD2BWG7_VESMC